MKTKIAYIKCTGERIEVRQDRIERERYDEIIDKNHPAKYGRRFHYSELTFEK